jgi:dihydroorotate dehydrogenase (fumarate)
MDGAQVERMHTDLVAEVTESSRIPVAVKLGPYFSAIPNMMVKPDQAGADGLVLFNRF